MPCKYLKEWRESVPYGCGNVGMPMSECICEDEDTPDDCDNCPYYKEDDNDGGIQ